MTLREKKFFKEMENATKNLLNTNFKDITREDISNEKFKKYLTESISCGDINIIREYIYTKIPYDKNTAIIKSEERYKNEELFYKYNYTHTNLDNGNSIIQSSSINYSNDKIESIDTVSGLDIIDKYYIIQNFTVNNNYFVDFFNSIKIKKDSVKQNKAIIVNNYIKSINTKNYSIHITKMEKNLYKINLVEYFEDYNIEHIMTIISSELILLDNPTSSNVNQKAKEIISKLKFGEDEDVKKIISRNNLFSISADGLIYCKNRNRYLNVHEFVLKGNENNKQFNLDIYRTVKDEGTYLYYTSKNNNKFISKKLTDKSCITKVSKQDCKFDANHYIDDKNKINCIYKPEFIKINIDRYSSVSFRFIKYTDELIDVEISESSKVDTIETERAPDAPINSNFKEVIEVSRYIIDNKYHIEMINKSIRELLINKIQTNKDHIIKNMFPSIKK